MNKGLLTGATALVGLTLSTGEVSATQPDVEAIDKVHSAIQAGTDADRLERALMALMLDQVSSLPEARTYPDGLAFEGSEFRGRLRQGVAKLVESAGGDPAKQARLLRSFSTPAAAEAIVAEYLGFDPPGSYLPESDEPPTKPTLDSQVVVGPSSRLLALTPDRWEIVGEIGGPGAGNGMLDAGEWVKLRIVLENIGDKPLFSSSAYVRTEGGCAWVDSEEEHLLAEMDAGTGRALLHTWVYLSGHCHQATGTPLFIDVFDTHQAPSAPQTLRATLRVTNLGAPAMSNVLLDTDTPGSSDGTSRVPIQPLQRFELASDLLVKGPKPERVQMVYHPEALAEALFDISYRDVPMISAGGSAGAGYRFLAGDDLDLIAAGSNEFERALGLHPEAGARATTDHTFTLFAVDAQLWLSSPERDQAVVEPAAPAPRPLRTADLIRLIQPHIHLTPRPTTTVAPDATEATDGYEVRFDKDAFGAAYESLVWPTAAEPETHDADAVPYTLRTYVAVPVRYEAVEPSCQIAIPRERQGYDFDDEIKLVGQVLNPPASSSADVSVRWISSAEGLVATTSVKAQGATSGITVLEPGTHTLTMSAVLGGQEICKDDVVVGVRGPRTAPEPEPAEPLDEYDPTRYRIDLGFAVGGGAVTSNEELDILFEAERATLLRVGGRATIGESLRSTWLIHVAPPSGAAFDSAHDEDRLFETIIGGGVAYGIGSGELAQLEPRLTAGLIISTLIMEDDPNDSSVIRPFVAPGATFILKPTRSVGVHVSMDLEVAKPWQPFNLDTNYQMMTGVGLRPGAGLSFAW